MTGFFIVLCAILSVASAAVALFAARNARAALASLAAEVHSHASCLESLKDSQTSTLETLEALANKVKMQRVRNVVAHGAGSSGEPDPYRDPNAWRQAMNRKLAMGRIAPKV